MRKNTREHDFQHRVETSQVVLLSGEEAGAQRLRGWLGGAALNGRNKSLHK